MKDFMITKIEMKCVVTFSQERWLSSSMLPATVSPPEATEDVCSQLVVAPGLVAPLLLGRSGKRLLLLSPYASAVKPWWSKLLRLAANSNRWTTEVSFSTELDRASTRQ